MLDVMAKSHSNRVVRLHDSPIIGIEKYKGSEEESHEGIIIFWAGRFNAASTAELPLGVFRNVRPLFRPVGS